MSIFARGKHAGEADLDEVQGAVEDYWASEAMRTDTLGCGYEPQVAVGVVDDATSPSYYKFPSGVEVIDVTGWLTSNGGQAVQYIARATRLDGVVKAETVTGQIEDLQKAQVFIANEIERLEIVRGD